VLRRTSASAPQVQCPFSIIDSILSFWHLAAVHFAILPAEKLLVENSPVSQPDIG
jgi:hypothetical protein